MATFAPTRPVPAGAFFADLPLLPILSRLGLIDHLAAGRVARRVEILRDRGMRLPVNLLVSMKNRGRSSQAIAEPSCG
jgi:hypothetical protein